MRATFGGLCQSRATLCTVFHRGRDCPLQGFKGIGTLQDYEIVPKDFLDMYSQQTLQVRGEQTSRPRNRREACWE